MLTFQAYFGDISGLVLSRFGEVNIAVKLVA